MFSGCSSTNVSWSAHVEHITSGSMSQPSELWLNDRRGGRLKPVCQPFQSSHSSYQHTWPDWHKMSRLVPSCSIKRQRNSPHSAIYITANPTWQHQLCSGRPASHKPGFDALATSNTDTRFRGQTCSSQLELALVIFFQGNSAYLFSHWKYTFLGNTMLQWN